jgi:carbon monoxide dehydrogenase subunit G
VEAKVGGKIAQLGSRLIDGFARKMADQFFERFQTHVEGSTGHEDAAEA